MNVADVVQGIADHLALGLPAGYHVLAHNPMGAISAPAVIVAPNASTFDDDFDGAWTLNVAVIVLLAHTGNAVDVQQTLWAHAQPTGDLSIRELLDDLDLDDVDEWVVVGFEAPGRFEIGGAEYPGVQINLEVMA